jgi:hypothetical protein
MDEQNSFLSGNMDEQTRLQYAVDHLHDPVVDVIHHLHKQGVPLPLIKDTLRKAVDRIVYFEKWGGAA